MPGKFELSKTRNGKFKFNLKAGNGQIILTSKSYDDRRGASNGIKSVRTNSAKDERFERKKSKKGDNYFVLKSSNGQTIAKSEVYSSAASVEKGIASVKKNAADGETKDLTK